MILTEIDKDKNLGPQCGLIYGVAGVGKTRFIITAAENEATSPVLIISYDGKDKTVKRFETSKNVSIDFLDVPRVAKDKNLTISRITEEIVKDLLYSKIKYRTVGFDGVSKLVNPLVYRDIISEESARRSGSHDPEIPDEFDYKRANIRVFNWLEQLKFASSVKNFHLFLTAREKNENVIMENYEGSLFYVDLPPTLRNLVMHEFDFVYRLGFDTALVEIKGKTVRKVVIKEGKAIPVDVPKKTKEMVRVLYTKPRAGMVIKAKEEAFLPKKLVNPTMTSLFNSLYSKEGCTLDEEESEEKQEEEKELV